MSDFATAYANACVSIPLEEGLTEIQEKLAKLGIKSEVEQTGGMCMVLFVQKDEKLIAISRDGDLFYVGSYADEDAFYDGDEESDFKIYEDVNEKTVHAVIDRIVEEL